MVKIRDLILWGLSLITLIMVGWLYYIEFVFIPAQPMEYFLARPPLMFYAAMVYLWVVLGGITLLTVWIVKMASKIIGAFFRRFENAT